MSETGATPIPRATYRLQFREGFGFRDAAALAPYLARLGISHLYTSPWLKARPGSQHGYDIVDHHALNPELGDEEAFHRMAATRDVDATGSPRLLPQCERIENLSRQLKASGHAVCPKLSKAFSCRGSIRRMMTMERPLLSQSGDLRCAHVDMLEAKSSGRLLLESLRPQQGVEQVTKQASSDDRSE